MKDLLFLSRVVGHLILLIGRFVPLFIDQVFFVICALRALGFEALDILLEVLLSTIVFLTVVVATFAATHFAI